MKFSMSVLLAVINSAYSFNIQLFQRYQVPRSKSSRQFCVMCASSQVSSETFVSSYEEISVQTGSGISLVDISESNS